MSLLDNLHACGVEVNNRLDSRKASVKIRYLHILDKHVLAPNIG